MILHDLLLAISGQTCNYEVEWLLKKGLYEKKSIRKKIVGDMGVGFQVRQM